jgi:aryl carrier-like protein
MIPTAWVRLDKLPVSPNGKLDRAALPAPETAPAGKEPGEAPRSEVEKKLSAIWAEVLQVECVGRDDDLLNLGADSIHVFQITARANRAGLTLAAKQLLRYRTIAKLAAVLEGGETAVQPRAYAFNRPASPKIEPIAGEQEGAKPAFTKARAAFSPSRQVKGE